MLKFSYSCHYTKEYHGYQWARFYFMKFFKCFKFFVTSLLLLTLVCALVHYVENKQPFYFPPLTGSYPVGTSIIYWIDHNRLEVHEKNKEHPYRELVGQIWYPANLQAQGKLFTL